ncbi:hypothetical protein Y694_00721 [Methylibium sp. T29-B]|nr:hypothetical protein Y694_00721 [Methylibium sp. T29-B]
MSETDLHASHDAVTKRLKRASGHLQNVITMLTDDRPAWMWRSSCTQSSVPCGGEEAVDSRPHRSLPRPRRRRTCQVDAAGTQRIQGDHQVPLSPPTPRPVPSMTSRASHPLHQRPRDAGGIVRLVLSWLLVAVLAVDLIASPLHGHRHDGEWSIGGALSASAGHRNELHSPDKVHAATPADHDAPEFSHSISRCAARSRPWPMCRHRMKPPPRRSGP